MTEKTTLPANVEAFLVWLNSAEGRAARHALRMRQAERLAAFGRDEETEGGE